ncbi:twitchin-like [Diadema setosum]|uniref:twitchin-like n=1 Tax=Diadema setosum TaxID=31175 RepID=UPI003B3B76D7
MVAFAVTSPDAPSAPTITEVTSNSVSLSWEPPRSDGGSPVKDYIVEKKDAFSIRWTEVSHTQDTTFKVPYLKEGDNVQFRVTAVNKAGPGKPSQSSNTVTIKPAFTVPDPPSQPSAEEMDSTSITLRWTPPKSDGGSRITTYVVEMKEQFAPYWKRVSTKDGTELTCQVTGLKENHSYEFRVTAINKAGDSNPSSVGGPFTIKAAYTVPSQPDAPEVSNIKATSMTVTWTRPKSDGGSPITGYTVEKCDTSSGRWVTVTRAPVRELTHVVDHLKEKSEYCFRVIAHNVAGESKPSEASKPHQAKPPYGLPDAPAKPDVTDIDATHITLSWSPPWSDGGTPITGYMVEKKDRFSVRWTRAMRDSIRDTQITLRDLSEGGEYEFRIAAENKAGVGPFSESTGTIICKSPFEVPSAPGTPQISDVSATTLLLKWTPPTSDGGAEITNYIIETRDRYGRWTRINRAQVLGTSFKVVNLTEGADYEFRVTAENKMGPGKPSDSSQRVTAKPPYSQPAAPFEPQVSKVAADSVDLAWSPPRDDGGSPITGYFVERKDKFSPRWTRVNQDAVTDTKLTVPGLIPGEEYQFRVVAENKAGSGKPSEPSSPVLAKAPYTEPGAPGVPEASKITEETMTLSWAAPSSDGGSPITGYYVEKKDRSAVRWSPVNYESHDTTTMKVTGLVEGNEYEFRVIAENKAGRGKPGLPCYAVKAKSPHSVPDAPGTPSISDTSSTAMTLRWAPPESDGGSSIITYVVERREQFSSRWVQINRHEFTDPTLTVMGLTEGSEYEFRVAAKNKVGLSRYSESTRPTKAKEPYNVPEAPTVPEVSNITGDTMTLTWSPPRSDGGSAITGYVIERREPGRGSWTMVNRAPVTDLSYTVPNLREGGEYEFRVIAENKAGLGKPSPVSNSYVAKPPYTVPGAPDQPEVTDVTSTTITITWNPPRSDGGSKIIGYTIEIKVDLSMRWVKLESSVPDTTYTASRLKENSEYQFRVAAINKAGRGEFSRPSRMEVCRPPYDPPPPPDTPTVSNITPTSAVLSWSPPRHDGGSPITGYVIDKKDRYSTRWTKLDEVSARETEFTIRGLQEGNDYEYRVSAVNAAGVGKPSTPCDRFTAKAPYDIPDAPQPPSISDINASSMRLSWEPPASDGGSPITGYIIEKRESPVGRWMRVNRVPTKDTSIKVNDLTEDKKYEFRVSAENAAGVGRNSEASLPRVAKSPYDAPSAPSRPDVSNVDSTELTLTWSPPSSDGGSPVTNYIIEARDRFGLRWSPITRQTVTGTTFRVTGLKPNDEYQFRVIAENRAGQSRPSDNTESVIAKPPYDVPDAPENVQVKATTSSSATLEWNRPFSDGGSPITGYIVERKDQYSSRWMRVNRTPVTDTSMVVGDLKDGLQYQFRVCAENNAGIGRASEPTRSTVIKEPIDAPSAPHEPTIAAITADSATLTWAAPSRDGGSPITGYIVERKDPYTARWSPVERVTDTTCRIPGLKEGNEYQFRVVAVNKAGQGAPSSSTEPRVAKAPYGLCI